jgi:tyrosine-protein kinase Etk/Wzc
LNDFNAQSRQSQARARRRFAEERVTATERELRRAEEDLKNFYERNRSWQQSPQLASEEGQLKRQLDIRQEVYLTLEREYETARIEEVNDTPVITVIEPAVPPQERSSPRRALLVALALMVAALVGTFSAFALEYADRVRGQNESEYREFQRLTQRAREDLRRIVRLFGLRR